jgi:putative hydrolase of the HAD superfamily
MGSLQVVLWDFDGTLAQRPGRWSQCLAETATLVDNSLRLRADDLKPGLRGGFPWHDHRQAHPHLTDPDAWWEALLPLLIRAYGDAGVDERTAAAAAGLVRITYTDPKAWSVYSDTRPALALLREHGWRHIVLSNHVPELPQLVDALSLGDLIDDVITSAAIGWEKPHPDMFRYALARAGRPDTVVMIGDNPDADIAGAIRAGIPAVLVRNPVATGIDLLTAADRIRTQKLFSI